MCAFAPDAKRSQTCVLLANGGLDASALEFKKSGESQEMLMRRRRLCEELMKRDDGFLAMTSSAEAPIAIGTPAILLNDFVPEAGIRAKN